MHLFFLQINLDKLEDEWLYFSRKRLRERLRYLE